MRLSFVSSVVAFTAATSAILVTYPPKGAKIDLGQPLTIKWDAVETDPAKFDLYVVNQAVNPSVTTLIASGVDTTKGSYTIPANDASLTGTDTGPPLAVGFLPSRNNSKSPVESLSRLQPPALLLDSNSHHLFFLFCDFVHFDFNAYIKLHEDTVYLCVWL
ncbi:UPF0619 GPI-anchored membrane protein [Penicillium diatomitis]|uniref:UPF0619 GPI-anchored membrane protein n=1 Tax=Penicillium diatomitis TaxID=2819901 RepID=A0A9W9XML0_9EURO|nr:UPF0619 GPI-anchored membrane protein [Penicillium diatomitis]KAJ5495749.1 UPF0619 GPI-anchored membrane protein [Penicillium diatomitis]